MANNKFLDLTGLKKVIDWQKANFTQYNSSTNTLSIEGGDISKLQVDSILKNGGKSTEVYTTNGGVKDLSTYINTKNNILYSGSNQVYAINIPYNSSGDVYQSYISYNSIYAKKLKWDYDSQSDVLSAGVFINFENSGGEILKVYVDQYSEDNDPAITISSTSDDYVGLEITTTGIRKHRITDRYSTIAFTTDGKTYDLTQLETSSISNDNIDQIFADLA